MVLDIIILILIVLAGFRGYKKGLVGIMVGLVSMILAIVLSLLLQGSIADMLYNNTGVGKIVEQTVYTNLNSANTKNNEESKNNETKTVDNIIIDSITSKATESLTSEETAKAVTMFILKGISFVIIFIIVTIVCRILQSVLNLVFNLPVLDVVNKFGGLGLGAIKVLLKIYIVLAIISFIAPMQIIDPVMNVINSSVVTKVLYENNLFVSLLSMTLKV